MRPAIVRRAGVLLLVASVSGCTSGATSSTPGVATAAIAQTSKLQFGVGTATIGYDIVTSSLTGASTISAGTVIGTNFTATFRGPSGLSATLTNTPAITAPSGFSFGFPTNANTIAGILPNVYDQAVLAAISSKPVGYLPFSFGQSLGPLVGVFGYGFAADNLLSSQAAAATATLNSAGAVCPTLVTTGANVQTTSAAVPNTTTAVTSEARSDELGLPLGQYAQGASANLNCPLASALPALDSNVPINYYGGPPAWPSAQGYGTPSFFVGYPLGFTDIASAPVAGKYTLDVAYATNSASSTYGHATASATLTSTTALPPLSISSVTVNADDSVTVVLTVPTGVYETVVLLRTRDCSGNQHNFSVVTHSVGTQSVVFGAKLGPPDASGQPSATICAASSNDLAYAVGFDYPAYESSYPFDTSQTPKITSGDGHTGQADITTSPVFVFSPGS